MVKIGIEEARGLQEALHVCCLPHEAASWVFNGKQHAILNAYLAQLLCQIVQMIGCKDSLLIHCAKVWQAVREII